MQQLLVVSNQYKYPTLAKPSGITLDQHIKDLKSEANELTEYFPITFENYQKKTGKSLQRRLEIVIDLHDDGKKHEKWQKACQLDYENYLVWNQKFGGRL